jgi:RNA polymerase III RPC4
MQLADAADDSEQLMFFQLPTLLPAPNRAVKSEFGRADARPRPPADDDDPPPKSLPIASAPGGLVSSHPCLSMMLCPAPRRSVVFAPSIPCVSANLMLPPVLHLQMGKLRVHKSGKVKLHLGDVAFDMMRGIACEVCNSPFHKRSGRAN